MLELMSLSLPSVGRPRWNVVADPVILEEVAAQELP